MSYSFPIVLRVYIPNSPPINRAFGTVKEGCNREGNGALTRGIMRNTFLWLTNGRVNTRQDGQTRSTDISICEPRRNYGTSDERIPESPTHSHLDHEGGDRLGDVMLRANRGTRSPQGRLTLGITSPSTCTVSKVNTGSEGGLTMRLLSSQLRVSEEWAQQM